MNTKAFILLLCLLPFAAQSFSQETDPWEKVHKNELSMNIKQAVNIFFFPTPATFDPYMLQYRRYIGGGAIRAGVGFNVRDIKNTTDEREFTQKNTNADVRLGWQFNHDIEKRFLLYYGADLFLSHYTFYYEYYNNPSQGLVIQESTNTTYGIAPLLGVQFYISPRVSIGTEANYRLGLQKSENETTYENWPQSNRKNESKGLITEFWQPSSLYLNIRF